MMSPSSRQFRKQGLGVLVTYFALFPAANYVVGRFHPTGAFLWMLASLPMVPILSVFVLLGRYLRKEKDEYKRDLVVRCLLWGTGGALTVSMFSSYLRIFGWKGQVFPFAEFYIFILLMLVAKLSYRAANKVAADE